MAIDNLKKYPSNESLERIYYVLNGDTVGSHEVNTEGDMPWNEALARIAMLLEGTEFGLRTPLLQYGEIYAWTGTAEMQALSSTVYNKITGTFQNYTNYLGVTPQPESDRILVTSEGEILRIDWQVSFIGASNLKYKFEPYYGGVGVPQAAAAETPNASGTAKASASGFGYQYISGTNVAIDLRVLPSATGWLNVIEAQLGIQRIGPRVNVSSVAAHG